MVVLGCSDAPLGGDRVLQCGSLRTSEALLSSCFTYDDCMPACCLSVHPCKPKSCSSSCTRVASAQDLSRAVPESDQQTGKQLGVCGAYETALLMFADIKVQIRTVCFKYISMWSLAETPHPSIVFVQPVECPRAGTKYLLPDIL